MMNFDDYSLMQFVTEITVTWLKTQKNAKSTSEVEKFIDKVAKKLHGINKNNQFPMPKNREEMLKFLSNNK